MANIFEYTNFRDYLAKCYEEKKQINPKYSYQAFSNKMGFNNKGFLFNVIKGKRNLSIPHHCYKLSKALRHTKAETDYFEWIVAFTQTKNEEERTYILEKMQQDKKGKHLPVFLGKDDYEYLSKWHYSAVRALIEMFPIRDANESYEFVSRKIFPPITVAQAKKSIELLDSLKIIHKGDDGFYHCTGKKIRASKEVSESAKNRFHIELTELAKQSVIYPPSNLHFVKSLTLGISEKTYHELNAETQKFTERLLDIAASDDAADRVYQYQLVLFPLTVDRDSKEIGK
jgi:uncharacterized protein (TIGR02147 family)